MLTEAKDNVVGGDNRSYKTCKAPVKSSPSTNQHPVFYRLDALPVTQPAVSKHWRGKTKPKTKTELKIVLEKTQSTKQSWVSERG